MGLVVAPIRSTVLVSTRVEISLQFREPVVVVVLLSIVDPMLLLLLLLLLFSMVVVFGVAMESLGSTGCKKRPSTNRRSLLNVSCPLTAFGSEEE